ncbi:hypothetical protein [Piscinibacter terrae]|uniref:Uncharacterized protein n=1 Tax=Piscinibacter terrae TaxID=2496871 RepID=A0A3N7HLS9_9BURK|nr:hypothetical protein [Albitalea terrae]RQP23070.1 hypothetical protein DZC73_18260 [Albitalea terrae]
MKRYRWLRAKWPISMRVLAKRLKAKGFEDGKTDGFVVDRARDDYLEARFVERVEYDDTVVDPFGKELSFHRVEYRQCEFRASVDGPGLELVDAPRAVQAAISGLAEATEFGLAIASLNLNVLAWAKGVQRLANISGIVDSVQIGAIELAPGITAKALVRGSTDVLSASNRLVDGKKHLIEKVQLKLPGSRKTAIVLAGNGTVRIDSEVPSDTVVSIRAALQELLGHD